MNTKNFDPAKFITSVFMLVLVAVSTLADVSFSKKRYDFGTIREENGPVTGRVYMTNLGPGPTYIRNVRTSCGCTDAGFTEGMIEEGDSAVITFTYDPEHRPGFFDKTVKVFVGEDNKMHLVRISGTVLASRETIGLNYPDSIGELRLSSKMIDGGEIRKGESRSYFVQLYNPTDRTIRPTAKKDTEALSIAIEPNVMEPGGTAVLGIYLNTRREPEEGKHIYNVEVCSDADGSFSDIGRVSVMADVIEKPLEP